MYLTPANLAVVLLAGGLAGLNLGCVPRHRGCLLDPPPRLGLGVPMHYAVATSILSVIATSSAVADTNVERGTANMRLGMDARGGDRHRGLTGGADRRAALDPRLEGLFALVLVPDDPRPMGRGRPEDVGDRRGGKAGTAPGGGEALGGRPGGLVLGRRRTTTRHADQVVLTGSTAWGRA